MSPLGASLSPMLATVFVGSAALAGVPFFLAGGVKIVYDVLLYRAFARRPGIRPGEAVPPAEGV